MTELEEIGKVCVRYYAAEQERIKAKIERAKARESHHCVVEREYYEDDTGAYEEFCYRSSQPWRNSPYKLPFEEWCDGCKFVKPYHDRYIAAAKAARVARYRLTRKIQRQVLVGEAPE